MPYSISTANNSWVFVAGEGDLELTNRMVTSQGIKNWNRKDAIIRTYFYTDRAGTVDITLECKTSGRQTIKVYFDDPQHTSGTNCDIVSSSSFQTVKVGSFHIQAAGYHFVDLVKQVDQNSVEIKTIIVDNEATRGEVLYIKKDSDNHFGRRGPSCHLGFSAPSTASDIEWFYNEIQVPRGKDVIGSYFMATGFSQGYFGIQVNSSTERRVLFSVWSAYKTDDPSQIPSEYTVEKLKAGDNVTVQNFGGEGSGIQSFLRYNWRAETTYKFLVRCKPTGNGETDFTGYFAPKGESFRLISSLRRPKTTTYATGLYSFLENFEPSTGCTERHAKYSNTWMCDTTGTWHEITSARFTYDDTRNRKVRLDCSGFVTGDSLVLKNCGFYSDGIPARYGQVLTRPAGGSSEQPQINFSKLP